MTFWKTTGLIVAAPFMGAAFCLFLPFLGFALLAKLTFDKSLAIMRHTFTKRIVA